MSDECEIFGELMLDSMLMRPARTDSTSFRWSAMGVGLLMLAIVVAHFAVSAVTHRAASPVGANDSRGDGVDRRAALAADKLLRVEQGSGNGNIIKQKVAGTATSSLSTEPHRRSNDYIRKGAQ